MKLMKKNRLALAIITSAMTATLAACGGSNNNGNGSEASVNKSSVTSSVAFAANDACPNGGITVNSGIDENGNGVLDENEIDNTQDVCNGVDGQDGQNGENGSASGAVLTRLAAAPLGAEFTGMYLNSDGSFFLNVQHPSTGNTTEDVVGKRFNKGTVGVVVGHNFSQQGITVPSLQVPVTQAEKEVVTTAVGSYQVLLQEGDAMQDGFNAGDIVNLAGTGLVKTSNDPDFNGVVSDGNGGFYVYSNWEDRTGGMSRTHVSGLSETGYTNIVKEGMIDFSSVNGTWVNCFGTVTPWGTPISAEELYFDNTAVWYSINNKHAQAATNFMGYPTDGSGQWANPYNYGFNVEVGTGNTVTASDIKNVEVQKRRALGRFSHENAVVMPDNRTVLESDDGSNTVFFKFVADQANDLSAGTLYAAHITQALANTPEEAVLSIDWIQLGHATDAEIESWIAEYNGTFAEAKYITDDQINNWAEAKTNTDLDGDGTVESNPFADNRVAFLETRKAAKALGASAEFNKMEGTNINYSLASAWWNNGAADGKQAYAYMAMSTLGSGMTDSSGDIQLSSANAGCGAVYRLKLVENNGLVDVKALEPAVTGGPYYSNRAVNKCDINNISNPDNIVVMDDGRVLIGEDTGNHQNNIVWLFDDPAI